MGYLIAFHFFFRQIATHYIVRRAERPSGAQEVGGRLILRSLWVLYIALLLIVVHRIWDAEIGFLQWLGYFILTIGTALRLSAIHTLGNMYASAINLSADHHIIRRGAYQFLRHPLYLGLSIEAVALAIITSYLIGYALALLIFTACQVQNRCEEYLLSTAMGTDYDQHLRNSWDFGDLRYVYIVSIWVAVRIGVYNAPEKP